MTEPLFRSAHEALVFAFRYGHDQSPRTPMTGLMQGGAIGSGKGLVGIDGAGQAGMILASLQHLPAEQRDVITVRYGEVHKECHCCGALVPTREWRDAVDALSHCDELGDLPRAVRLAAVEKALCSRRISMALYASQYSVAERTVRERVAKVKDRLGKAQAGAMAWLEDHFQGRGLLIVA
jgi:hypothetical protein